MTNDKVNVILRIMPSGDEIDASLPLKATGSQIVKKLQSDPNINLAKSDTQGCPISYNLKCMSSGKELSQNKSLEEEGVSNGDILLLAANIIAGGPFVKNENPNRSVHADGLFDDIEIPNIEFHKLINNGEAMSIMLRRYSKLESLAEKHKEEIDKLLSERQSGITSTILLVLAQIVTAVGVNLVTTDKKSGWIVFGTGIIITIFGLFIKFFKPVSR